MHIHILAIAGSKTAPLAKILKKQGNTVTGSDQEKIYPPFNHILFNSKIPVNKTIITKDIDLMIVGNSFKHFPRCQQEYQQAKNLDIPIVSYTDYIVKNLLKNNSILISGTYGKTTITSLVSWILLKAKYNPSYMFGGESVNKISSTKFESSPWSVIEACESINGLDTISTFLYYPAKYVLLTSADWEHKDSYKTEKDNLNAFKKLVQKIPKDGFLVYNPKNKNAVKISKFCQTKTIPYDYKLKFSTRLIGKHNQENIIAAYTLCKNLGIKDTIIKSAIKSFKGIKRRLELLADKNHILFFDDFAQSSDRIFQATSAIKNAYPQRPIKVFYEPHASFLQYKPGLVNLDKAFSNVETVILGQIKFNPSISKDKRVTSKDFYDAIGKKTIYLPPYPDVVKYFSTNLKPNDIFLHLSSGGLEGANAVKKIIQHFNH